MKAFDQNIAVSIESVSKRYYIVDSAKAATIQGLLHIKNKKEFWALKNINLEIKKGESLGIIGPNGAGKSTLLKILSGITKPTQGKVEIFGKIASVLEIGIGFHPDLTGRENVYLSAGLLGFSKSHIKAKFQEIVDFSEINDFIDTPVKHYSSGMFIRLAFSLVSNIDADILLFDEALNVGDSAFQQKSTNKIFELIDSGKTVIIVSHNMNDITKLCNRVAYIENGEIKSFGKPNVSVLNYLSEVGNKISGPTYLATNESVLKAINNKCETIDVSILSVKIFPKAEPLRDSLYWCDELVIQTVFKKTSNKLDLAFGFNFFHQGYLFLSINSLEAKSEPCTSKDTGVYIIETSFDSGFFNTAHYNIDLFVSDDLGENTLQIKNALFIEISNKPDKSETAIFRNQSLFAGPMKTQTKWKLKSVDPKIAENIPYHE